MNNWTNENVEARQTSAAEIPHPGRDSERSTGPLTNEQADNTARASAPIGVFASGAGGLSTLTALREELPHENSIYITDTAHCPYGVRSDEEITELTIEACRFLLTRGVKLI